MLSGFSRATILLFAVSLAACGSQAATATPVPPTEISFPTATTTATAVPVGLTVDAPPGPPPTLDGTLSPGEWDSALELAFSDGSQLFLMHDGGYLYVGIRALRLEDDIIGSFCLDRGGNEVAILHSSAAVGTAVYQKAGDSWQLTSGFEFTARGTDDSPEAQAEREQFLAASGWLASLATMGVPGETEYQIEMPEGLLRLAVAYQPFSTRQVVGWPAGLNDDCATRELIEGHTADEGLQFLPETWATISASDQPVPPPLGGSGSRLIAFDVGSANSREIYVMRVPSSPGAPTSDPVRLTNNGDEDWDPVWSPDGTRIAFTSRRGGDSEIYVMNSDGSAQGWLTNNSAEDFDPAWSPDGTRIAFTFERDGNREIYVMDASGGHPLRLTDEDADDFAPAWSPDGTQIAFTSERDGSAEIYVVDVPEGEPSGEIAATRLTGNDADDTDPAWSPDGARIAFASNRDGNSEIYVMNADGSDQWRLTDTPADEAAPAWSPDGEWMAFTSNRDSDAFEIYIMRADGTEVWRITDDSEINAFVNWRPF